MDAADDAAAAAAAAADANFLVPIDSIIKELGFGKFQAITLVFVVIAMSLKCIACTTFIFSTREPLYRCKIDECETTYEAYLPEWLIGAVPYGVDGAPNRCVRYSILGNTSEHQNNIRCEDRIFDANSEEKCFEWIHEENHTLVEELRLECQDWKRALVGTVNGLGQLVCFVYAGLITDKYGRKNMMVYASAISGVLGTVQSFSTNYWMFAVLEFLNTAITSGVYNSAFVLGIEILPPSKRVICTCFLYVTNSLALMLLGAVAWQFRHWRTLLRITYCPTILMIIFISVIPKSLKWLIAKGSNREAAVIIRKAARLNGVILSEKTTKYIDELSDDKVTQLGEMSELASVPFRDVLRSSRLRLRLLVCTFCWITNSFVYYGLMVNSVTLTTEGTNMYLNFVLVCAVEIPGQLVYLSLLDKFGRRNSLSGSLLLCGVVCALHAAVDTSSWLSLMSFLAAKLLITVSYSIIYVYTAEMFPTTVRNSCLSYCCMVGSLGTLAAPQTALLKPQHAVLLYGGLSLLSGVSVITFPETTKIQLPDTVEEAENLGLPKSNKISLNVN